jgi:ElaB/YqjD/DUF883 family membrane-anchored ribosome-binding protein
MPADVVVSRELKSLQEELSAAQRARLAVPAASPSSPEQVREQPDERELRNQLRELADEVTHFLEQAEKSIAEHPAQSVIGGLVVGILIGRLLGAGVRR